MRPFEYIRPESLDEAGVALSRPGARALAGGTDLLGEMKDEIGTEYPQVLVDLKSLQGMDDKFREQWIHVKCAENYQAFVRDTDLLKQPGIKPGEIKGYGEVKAK